MRNGRVLHIFTARTPRGEMLEQNEVMAVAGQGLQSDRYAIGNGSYNQGEVGKRQVTIINARFIQGSGFKPIETRRNLVTKGIELMWLIGREFRVGNAIFRGVKYCDPCRVPGALARNGLDFQSCFEDCGGLIAEVLESGLICTNDQVIPPPKNY